MQQVIPTRCPCCGKPMPLREWLTYRRREDCWVATLFTSREPMSRPRPHPDFRRLFRESKQQTGS